MTKNSLIPGIVGLALAILALSKWGDMSRTEWLLITILVIISVELILSGITSIQENQE